MNKSYAHLEKSPPSYKSLTPISRMTCKTDLKEPNFRLKLKQFKSKEEKVAEYNNSLKKINSIIDRYDHYESKSELEKLNKTMHDKVIDNLTNLRCVKSYLETNFELVTENENPGILVKLLDILMNAQDYQGCMTCTCKEIRSLSPIKKNWHHQSKENSKNYVAKSFILKQQPEKCVKCDCIVIGKNSSGICEWCLDQNLVKNPKNLAVVMKIKSLNLKKPRKKDLETTSEKINTTRAVQDEGLPEKSSWLNLEIQIGDKIMRLRDADNFLCRFQVNQNPDEQNDSNNKSFITEPSVQLTPVRPSTPNFMKQTLNSESRFKPFTQIPDDLSSIKPSKEALIQKIHEIKSNGKTVITHLNLLLEKQLKTQPKNFKKSTNKLIPKVSHHLRSLMTGILEFLPDHAIGLEKIFKIMVYTLETSLSFLDSQHSAQMELSNFYKGKQSEIEKSAKIIEDLKNENLFNSRASLQKIMKLENMVSKYKHMIKLYEMELENKTKIDYPMYDDLMFK